MTKLILAGSAICAFADEVTEEPWGYATSFGHYPFTAGVTEVVEADLPPGFDIADWSYVDGALVHTPRPAPPRPADVVQAEVVEATQARLDAFAQTRKYDGILSLCTYATSPTAKFKAEGQYGVAARDATWAKLYAMLAEVQAGTRPMPNSYADIEPELPALTWPA